MIEGWKFLEIPPLTLYHYNDGARADAVADGFVGRAEKGKWIALN